MEWYKSHNYKPVLPANIRTEGQIVEFINNNFKENSYKNEEEKLDQEYKKIEKKFVEKLKILFHSIPSEIEVLLTKYGIGGSYIPPNKVIINIRAKKPRLEILKHEILHLFLEDEVKTKGLSQEEKEKLIESFENKIS